MERYTTEDGSALPDELFDEDWRCRRNFVLWSVKDIETLRAVLEHEPDWVVRVSAMQGVDFEKNAIWSAWRANQSTCSHDEAIARMKPYYELIERCALRDPSWRVRLLATLRSYSADDETLVAIAINDESEIVRRAAADSIRERLREERKSNPNEKRPIFAVEEFLPAEVKRYRFYVDSEKIEFRMPDGETAFDIRPEIEAYSFSYRTGGDWLELRKAILEAKEEMRTLLQKDVPLLGRGYSHYYFQIKPMGKGMTELRFLECPSGCETDDRCSRKEWEANPGAFFDNCGGCLMKYRLVLPYSELSAAARDAVVRNEDALLSLEDECVSRWEDEEIDAGIRE